jgi:hypothetical protein
MICEFSYDSELVVQSVIVDDLLVDSEEPVMEEVHWVDSYDVDLPVESDSDSMIDSENSNEVFVFGKEGRVANPKIQSSVSGAHYKPTPLLK